MTCGYYLIMINIMTNVNVYMISKDISDILIPSTNYKTENFTDTNTNLYKAIIIHLLHVTG